MISISLPRLCLEGLVKGLVRKYFQDIQTLFTTAEFTMEWQQLEIGIMTGWAISLLVFTMAMDVIIQVIIASLSGSQEERGFSQGHYHTMHEKLNTNQKRARKKVKPEKSRSISIVRCVLSSKKGFVQMRRQFEVQVSGMMELLMIKSRSRV